MYANLRTGLIKIVLKVLAFLVEFRNPLIALFDLSVEVSELGLRSIEFCVQLINVMVTFFKSLCQVVNIRSDRNKVAFALSTNQHNARLAC